MMIIPSFSKWLLFLCMSICIAGCQTCDQTCEQIISPAINCPLQTESFTALPTAFLDLTNEECKFAWAQEMQIADHFAREWDLYRAITCYKRALVLLPKDNYERRLQIDYCIILCYYLGNKYEEALSIFETSELSQAEPSFPAFQNLLVMIYDCYLLTHQEDKAACVLSAIDLYSPETSEDLQLYTSLKAGSVSNTKCLLATHRDADDLQRAFTCFAISTKSPQKARALNAILPGAGYYYVGQNRSAITSFVINALFTAAAYQFFDRGYPAAGAIVTSLELGWYLGGINGAGIEAQQYNTRLYEAAGRQMLMRNKGFPVLMFETSF